MKRRIISFRLVILLVVFCYSGLSAYSGTLLPLRLVIGSSMEPTLRAGDIILLKAIPFSQINRGDVIAYKAPDAEAMRALGAPETVLHRVTRIEVRDGRRVLQTRGDNSGTDPWLISSEAVQGKLALWVPAVGRPLMLLTTTRGIAIASIAAGLAAIPAALVLRSLVIKRSRRTAQQSIPALENSGHPNSPEIDTDVSPLLPEDAVSTNTYAHEQAAYLALNRLWTQTADAASAAQARAHPYLGFNRLWPHPRPDAASLAAEAAHDLTTQYVQVKASIMELSDSIARYSNSIQSHTSAVQDLAGVTRMLEDALTRQKALADRVRGER